MLKDKNILVLMSSYNGEKYIKDQIQSIMKQSICGQVSLRIRDDGSTDRTCAIVEQFSREYPGKIELIRGENRGYNASFFELLNCAEGYDYYAFCDQDDFWLSCKLEVALKALLKEDDSIPLLYASTSFLVHDDMIPYGQTRRKQRPFHLYNTLIQNICPGHTQVLNNTLVKMLRKESFHTARIYVYDAWIMNYAFLYGKIIFNNSSFAYYRQHSGNQLGSGKGRWGKLFESARRSKRGDGQRYREQIQYFVEMNREKIENEVYLEVDRFLRADTIAQRFCYLAGSKLYRQSRMETMAFKIAVLFKKF